MRKVLLSFLLLMCVTTGCREEETSYPDIVTELADVKTDKTGVLSQFTTDIGHTFHISNRIEGYRLDTVYRAVCGYVPDGNQAIVYQLQGVLVLKDSTDVVRHDPTDIRSAWRTAGYLNMHLSPRTQGGIQHWGFCIDSLHPGHCYISLHHSQYQDAASYNQDLFASIGLHTGATAKTDTISLDVYTFKGKKRWTFPPLSE